MAETMMMVIGEETAAGRAPASGWRSPILLGNTRGAACRRQALKMWIGQYKPRATPLIRGLGDVCRPATAAGSCTAWLS